MRQFEKEIPVQLEFRAMEFPVTVRLPQPVMRYLDIYADRCRTHNGEVVYKQGDRDRPMPSCLLPRRESTAVRP